MKSDVGTISSFACSEATQILSSRAFAWHYSHPPSLRSVAVLINSGTLPKTLGLGVILGSACLTIAHTCHLLLISRPAFGEMRHPEMGHGGTHTNMTPISHAIFFKVFMNVWNAVTVVVDLSNPARASQVWYSEWQFINTSFATEIATS